MKIKIFDKNLEEFMPLTFETFNFNGGEPHVKLDNNLYLLRMKSNYEDNIKISLNIKSSDDFIKLLLVTDTLKRFFILYNLNYKIDVEIRYFPAARQDRQTNENEPFSLKVYTDIINSQNYNSVTIWDAHSDVTPALLNNCINIKQVDLIGHLICTFYTNNLLLLSPDAGANKKTFDISKKYGIPVIRADKIRDTKTGNILETVVYSEHLGNKDVLIVDDIGDGLKTFEEIAKVLKEKTNGKIMLYVTHGIFSRGIDFMDGIIDKVYCPNILLDDWEVKNKFNILEEIFI